MVHKEKIKAVHSSSLCIPVLKQAREEKSNSVKAKDISPQCLIAVLDFMTGIVS